MPTQQIFEGVSKVLELSLSPDIQDIVPSATLCSLGATDEIDFDDLAYRLGKEFGLTLDEELFFPESVWNTMTIQDTCDKIAGLLEAIYAPS